MSLVFYHMVAAPGEPILPECWGLESLGLLVGFIISQGADEKNSSAAVLLMWRKVLEVAGIQETEKWISFQMELDHQCLDCIISCWLSQMVSIHMESDAFNNNFLPRNSGASIEGDRDLLQCCCWLLGTQYPTFDKFQFCKSID